MSRSFGKKSQGYSLCRGWHNSMRARERLMLHREMRSEDPGDVVFPVAKEFPRDYNINFAPYDYIKDTRNDYFTEIRNILNGYQRWWHSRKRHSEQPEEDYQKAFIESFHRIKRRESPEGTRMYPYPSRGCFEWLHTREAKEAVKEWEGDPLDILYHLVRSGIIEKAVCIKLKRMVRK